MNKRLLLLTLIITISSQQLSAQWYSPIIRPSAPSSFDSFINKPGITLLQIIDTLNALVDSTDSVEGGPKDQLEEFKHFWKPRVVTNDSSGFNMFAEYFHALSIERATAMVGCGSGPDFHGNWHV